MKKRLTNAYRSLVLMCRDSGDSFSARLRDNFYLIRAGYSSAMRIRRPAGAFFGELLNAIRRCSFSAEELTDTLKEIPGISGLSFTMFDDLPAYISAACIVAAADRPHEDGAAAVELLRGCRRIDFDEFRTSVSVSDTMLRNSFSGYEVSDEKTAASYRRAVTRYAGVHGVSEREAISRVLSESEKSGEMPDRLLLAPPLGGRVGYLVFLAAVFAALNLLSALAAGYFAFFLIIPLLEASYCTADFVFSRLIRVSPPARVAAEKLPQEAGVLTVITALINGDSSDDRLFEALERFFLLNRGKNRFFGILADYPDSTDDSRPPDSEDRMRRRIGLLNRRYGGRFFVFVREREFKDGIYAARERKRGAVTDLVKTLCGKKPDGFGIIGGSLPDNIRYLFTVDSDTNLSLGSVDSLLGVLCHPANRPAVKNGRVCAGHALVQPAMRTELFSGYRTAFSRLVSGIGGIDVYETAGFDRWQSLFGEGVFCGKGMFDVKLFDKLVTPAVPDGAVLSHDMPEGNILRACLVTDTALTDSTPKSAVSYYKRLHRWLRGDTQNALLPLPAMGAIGNFKIASNLLRHLAPLFSLLAVIVAAVTDTPRAGYVLLFALLYLLLPAVLSLISAAFGKAYSLRRFFSQSLTVVSLSLSRAYFEVSALAAVGFLTADAVLRACYRVLYSHRRLLEWTTAAEADSRTSGLTEHIARFFASSVLGVLIFFFCPNPLMKLIGAMWFTFPLLGYLLSAPLPDRQVVLSQRERETVTGYARDSWRFFNETVNDKTGWLPPDNLQLSPAESTAMRTSPTDIGLYLLSAASAHALGIIGSDEFALRVNNALDTVEAAPKYRGHLYNWYSLPDMTPIGEKFVSTVDSGNWCACLVALREYCLESGFFTSAEKCGRVYRGTDFSFLYSRRDKLFSLGCYADTGRNSEINYDLYMSEARTASYLCLAEGIVPKEHWAALGRPIIARNGYLGMASWSGSAFEYFMPHLFLPLYRNSFPYEALCYAAARQKRYSEGGVFGVSESGFYAFDADMNYQYRAHGVPSLALRPYDESQTVFSPYSLFLMLRVSKNSCLRSLAVLRDSGMYGEYGFYEALDCKNGCRAVRSYMAHHTGMIICAAANALRDDMLVRCFMAYRPAGAAYELLQDRIPQNPTVFERPGQSPFRMTPVPGARFSRIRRTEGDMPSVSVITDGTRTAAVSDLGHVLLGYGGFSVNDAEFTADSLRHSLRVDFSDGKNRFGCAPLYGDGQYSFARDRWSVTHISESPAFTGRVRYSFSAEGDCFRIEARAEQRREFSVALSFLPVLCRERTYRAHPAFSGLFTESRFIRSGRILLLWRNRRDAKDKTLYCAVAAADRSVPFDFSVSRDNFRPGEAECGDGIFTSPADGVTGSCISPYCLIRTPPLRGGEITFLIACGFSAAEVRKKIALARKSRSDRTSLLLADTTYSGERLISGLFFSENREIKELPPPRRALWKKGISGDFPIITFTVSAGCEQTVREYADAFLRAFSGSVSGELVFLCAESDGYSQTVIQSVLRAVTACGGQALIGVRGGIFVLELSSVEDDTLSALRAYSSVFDDVSRYRLPDGTGLSKPAAVSVGGSATIPKNALVTPGGWFSGGKYVCTGFAPRGAVRSFVLAGINFGSIITSTSVGWSFFGNSVLRNITPAGYDGSVLSGGERIFAVIGGVKYDLAASSYETSFEPGRAYYRGRIGGTEYCIEVFVCAKLPVKAVRVTFIGGEEHTVSYRADGVCAVKSGGRLLLYGTEAPQGRTVGFIRAYGGGSTVSAGEKSVSSFGNEHIFAVGAAYTAEGCAAVDGQFDYRTESEKAALFAASLLLPVEVTCRSRPLMEMMNRFAPWQNIACRILARSSFYQNGGAYGFRDQLQDGMAAVYQRPDITRRIIISAAAHQYDDGSAMHWWHQINGGGNAGYGTKTDCSDDYLFLPIAVAEYIRRTGDEKLLDIRIPFLHSDPLSGGERYEPAVQGKERYTLYEHCLRAIKRGFRTGRNGLSLMGSCDWNDSFSSVGGESTVTSFLFVIAADMFSPYLKDSDRAEVAAARAAMVTALDENAYSDDRWVRAFWADGSPMGVEQAAECRIDLTAQALAAIALGRTPRTEKAVRTAFDRLYDPEARIIKLFDPPFTRHGRKAGYVNAYPPGVRENGGQYTHAALWYSIACFICGERENGLRILSDVNPATRGEGYLIEPYAIAADIYSGEHAGRGGWSFYTGSAGWYIKAVLEHAMGIELTGGYRFISVSASFPYSAVITRRDFVLTVSASSAERYPRLDGEEVAFPLEIPRGEHTLTVPVNTQNESPL